MNRIGHTTNAGSRAMSVSQMSVSRRGFVMGGLGILAGLTLASCTNADDHSAAGSAQAGSAPTTSDAVTMRIGALKGPTGMGLVGLMDATGALSAPDNDAASPVGTDPAGIGSLATTYEFTLAGSADELAPRLIQGDLDALCVPANLAATLYQRTEGNIVVSNINTLGVLDIVEAGQTIQTVHDLAGRTIHSAGRGSTPQYALEYILRAAGLEPGTDVSIEWHSEHAECLAALQADPTAVCMLPQPFATSALSKVDGARIAIDLSEAWNDAAASAGSDATLVTGVTVVRRAFVQDHPDAVEEFLDAYARSVDFVNDDPATAAQLIEAAGIIDATVAERAIPYCHIVCTRGETMHSELEGYLQTLADADPSSVGGSMPDDDFYLVDATSA
ncbi:ABC transporter substrate-binding protein [Collinsella sp. An2]|uniref:ABC transporter substrate-binding protein n=1 Tax=Collinsella sp. An2 TaxID=1965585 RepID=UPI001EF6BFB5|nr:ABC transporter substrate-binding protein [Collinsella sp. An2]